jgi:hypothetical protein
MIWQLAANISVQHVAERLQNNNKRIKICQVYRTNQALTGYNSSKPIHRKKYLLMRVWDPYNGRKVRLTY